MLLNKRFREALAGARRAIPDSVYVVTQFV